MKENTPTKLGNHKYRTKQQVGGWVGEFVRGSDGSGGSGGRGWHSRWRLLTSRCSISLSFSWIWFRSPDNSGAVFEFDGGSSVRITYSEKTERSQSAIEEVCVDGCESGATGRARVALGGSHRLVHGSYTQCVYSFKCGVQHWEVSPGQSSNSIVSS